MSHWTVRFLISLVWIPTLAIAGGPASDTTDGWVLARGGFDSGAASRPAFGAEQSLVAASGPFEVSGQPDSYAVASIRTVDDFSTLWVTRFERGRQTATHLVAGAVDPAVRPTIHAGAEEIAVAWRAGDGWHLAHLGGSADAETHEVTHLPIQEGMAPLAVAVSSEPGKLLAFLAPAQAVSGESAESLAATPVLVKFDVRSREGTLLHSFPLPAREAAVSFAENRIHVAYVETTTGDLLYTRLDREGTELTVRKLNTFPVLRVGGIGSGPEGTSIAWIEDRPENPTAMLAGVYGTDLRIVPVSSMERSARSVSLGEHDRLLAVWEDGDDTRIVTIAASDASGSGVRAFEHRETPQVNAVWILGGPEDAVLLRERASDDGGTALTAQPLRWNPPDEPAGVHELAPGDVAAGGDGGLAPLGGLEDVCDGLDNDGDGDLDEYCDRTCENPGLAGTDRELNHFMAAAHFPSMVWTGFEYALAWYDSRHGNYEIYFARLDPTGAMIGSELRVTNDSAGSSAPSLVWNGVEYAVAWEDYRDGNNNIYLARIHAAGIKIGGDILITNVPGSHETEPSLVWTGSEYGLAWADSRHGPDHEEIYFCRINFAGVKLTGDLRITNVPLDSQSPALVWASGQYGLAWSDYRGMNWDIHFTLVSASGVKLIGDLNISNDIGASKHPSLVWTGSSYGLAWDDAGAITFTWLDPGGTNHGFNEKIAGADPWWPTHPSVAWTGSEYAVSWEAGVDDEIYIARVDTAGHEIGTEVQLTNESDTSSMESSLVWNGTDFGIAWIKSEGNFGGVWFANVRCCEDADGDGQSVCDGDTNDSDPTVHPGALEVCDARDNDGDGSVDEGCDRQCDDPVNGSGDERIPYLSGNSEVPSLAWNGNGYGVVWEDNYYGNREILFARLDASGKLVPASRVRITTDDGDSGSPSLVWTGSEYGLTWHDDRSGMGNYEIYFARLDAAGAVIGSEIRLTTTPFESQAPVLVWTGTDYGIAWQDNRDGNWDAYFARLDSVGNRMTDDVQLTEDLANVAGTDIVWTGTEYGIVWRDKRHGNWEIFFTRVDALGDEIGAESRITNDPGYSAGQSLVWTGSEYGVVWNDARAGDWEVYFARIDADGSKLGSDVLLTTDDTSNSWYPSLAWSGSEYSVAWHDNRNVNNEIYFATLDGAGTRTSAETRLTIDSGGSRYASLVWSGTGYAVAWQDSRDGNWEIYAARIDCCDDLDGDGYSECAGDSNDADPAVHPGAGEVCDGVDNDSDTELDEGCDRYCDDPGKWESDVRVTSASNTSDYPSLDWTGSEYGVVWEDSRDGNPEIYFARLDAAGSVIPWSEVRVTNDPGMSQRPSLAWTGSDFGIAWYDDRDGNTEIYFALLDPAGVKQDEDARITYDEAQSVSPELAWTGSEFGIVWADDRSGTWEVHLARLELDGTKIGQDLQVSSGDSSNSFAPVVAWTGSEFGIAWRDKRDGNWEVYFQRIGAHGNGIESNLRLTYDPGYSSELSLVWSPGDFGEYGISWNDSRDGDWELYAARLDTTGNPVFPEEHVSTNYSTDSTFSSIEWTGSEFAVAWQDNRDGNNEIYLCRLDGKGKKVGAEVRITGVGDSRYPSLVWNGSRYGVAWQDARDGNWEIYFAHVECCDDVDGDTWSECNDDCDDGDPDVHPFAPERCNFFDDDCDGDIDEDFLAPAGVGGLHFESDKETVTWNAVPGADRYDVVLGNLMLLRSTAGDFEASLGGCIENDSLDTSSYYSMTPFAGEGYYFLVRAVNDCVPGSYDTTADGQVGGRDLEIGAVSSACP